MGFGVVGVRRFSCDIPTQQVPLEVLSFVDIHVAMMHHSYSRKVLSTPLGHIINLASHKPGGWADAQEVRCMSEPGRLATSNYSHTRSSF